MKNFMYRGRVVVGIKPLSVKQYLKTYVPIFLWTLMALFVIVRNAICDCVYLTVATVTPVIMVTIGTFLWTYFVKKDMIRKNYIYEPDWDEEPIKQPDMLGDDDNYWKP